MSTPDYYAVLGVSPGSEPVVIKAAYKALMLKYHPDQNLAGGSAADSKAKALNEAYSVLSNPEKRKAYDAQRKAGPYQRTEKPKTQAPPKEAAAPPRAPTPAAQVQDPPSGNSWGMRVAQCAAILLVIAGGKALLRATPSPAVATEAGYQPTDPVLTSEEMQAPPAIVEPEVEPASEAAPDTAVHDEQVRKGVEQFDRVFSKGGLLGAAAYSRECFEGAETDQNFQRFDFCVAFDNMARVIDQAAAGSFGSDGLSYFDRVRVDARHRKSLAAVTGDSFLFAFDRLDDLRDRSQEQMRYVFAAKAEKELASEGAKGAKAQNVGGDQVATIDGSTESTLQSVAEAVSAELQNESAEKRSK